MTSCTSFGSRNLEVSLTQHYCQLMSDTKKCDIHRYRFVVCTSQSPIRDWFTILVSFTYVHTLCCAECLWYADYISWFCNKVIILPTQGLISKRFSIYKLIKPILCMRCVIVTLYIDWLIGIYTEYVEIHAVHVIHVSTQTQNLLLLL